MDAAHGGGRAYRPPRTLRHDPWGLSAAVTTVGGRPVRSLSAGESDDLPEVLMLPGLGAPGYIAAWARTSSAWTRTTVLDLPGWHGGRATACPPSVEAVGHTAAGWLELTDRPPVVLVGHSSGAQSALRTALDVPDRIAGVVLAGPTLDVAARPLLRLLGRVAQTLRHEISTELSVVGRSYLASGGSVGRLMRSSARDRPEDLVGFLPMPVAVVVGREDRISSPPWARHIADLAGGSCTLLPGAHNCCFTYPHDADTALHDIMRGWRR